MENKDFQKLVFEELEVFFNPLVAAIESNDSLFQFFITIGWDLEKLVGEKIEDLKSNLNKINEIVLLIKEFKDGPPKDFIKLKDALLKTSDIFNFIQSAPASILEFGDMGALLVEDIFHFLLYAYLDKKNTKTIAIAELLLMVDTNLEGDRIKNGEIIRDGSVVRRFDFKKAVDFIGNPISYLQKYYFSNLSNLDEVITAAQLFYPKLANVLREFGFVSYYGYDVGLLSDSNEEDLKKIEEDLKNLLRFITADTYLFNAEIGAFVKLLISAGIMPGGGIELYLEAKLSSQTYFGKNKILDVSLDSSGGIKLENKKLTFGQNANLKGGLSITSLDDTTLLIGDEDGSNLRIGKSSIGAKIESAKVGNDSKLVIEIINEIKDAQLVVKPSEEDGFLKSIFSKGIDYTFSFSLGFSNLNGFHFSGSGGLEINLSKNINLGLLELLDSKINISPQLGQSPGIGSGFGTTLKGNLGPLKVIIEDLGLKFNLGFPPDMKGNLGIIDLDLGMKPPKGVGLSIDARAFRGGGYLYIDPEKGEYMGALELEVFKLFNIKAIGIITTKLPDGSPGFSLLILVTAEFTAVQLGFGFTLNGVGGLLGLNRTSNQEEIGLRIREGTASEIFFPQNVVANIKPIISSLKAVFPQHQGNFVFGPMGKIGWGTPTIVEAELGMIIDVPDPVRIAIIGVARLDLPFKGSQPLAVVQLRMAFMISVDFGRKMFSIDASLFDSRVLMYTLSGDFALRIGWGANPMFIFSVGGFHPKYLEAPVELQTMKRLTIRILDTFFLKIGCEFYLAVTSNTAQFGVYAYLLGKAGPVEATGYIKFDVLFQFRPFYFIATIDCSASLLIDLGVFGRHELFSIRIFGELSGPEPWHFLGFASFKILWFEIQFQLEHAWGDDPQIAEPLQENVEELLLKEFDRQLNWQGIPDPGSVQGVTIGPLNPDEIVLFPSTILRFSQKAVPLSLTLEKFGEAEVSGANRFEITNVQLGSKRFTPSAIPEQFAPANFLRLSDDEKTSCRSYEEMQGGIEFKIEGDNQSIGDPTQVDIEYEVNYLQSKERVNTSAPPQAIEVAQFNRQNRGSAAFRSPLSKEVTRPSHHAPAAIRKKKRLYHVVKNVNAEITLKIGEFGSQAEAFQFLVTEAQKDSSVELEIITQYV